MMKDTPDGRTHHFNDGCIPPHIQQNKWNKDCFMCQNLGFACEFHLKYTPTQQKCNCSEINAIACRTCMKLDPPTQHTCCDGECNHDDCCGKIPENCPLLAKKQYHCMNTEHSDKTCPINTQPEWIPKLTQLLTIHATGKYHSESLFISELKFLISTTIQKEIERERRGIVKEIKRMVTGDYSPEDIGANNALTSIQEFIKSRKR